MEVDKDYSIYYMILNIFGEFEIFFKIFLNMEKFEDF